jgi:beta-glucosidase
MHKAVAAINGGNDVDFPRGTNYQYLQQAIDEGLVKPEVLERAVKNVLRYKQRAGLFDRQPYLYSKEQITLDTPEERQTAYDIAAQSIVLLENNGILPLKDTKNLLLTGPNANTMWAMCGDYSFPAMTYFWKKVTDDLDHPHTITLLEGMKARLPEGVNLLYERGCDWTEEIETKYSELGDERAWEYEILHRKVDAGEKADKAEALRLARQADVIIAAVGENVMLCGENRDRQGLRLPGRQEQYVEELLATGKPVVLVVFGGRAQVISGLAERCAAVVQAWYPGEEGGNAVADILFGNVSPSAKLSISYPNTEVYEPLCYNYSAGKDPRVQWPFGYGLSYTTFEYGELKVSKTKFGYKDRLTATIDVKNTGNYDAKETVHFFIADPACRRLTRPVKELKYFDKQLIKKGETKTFTFEIDPKLDFGHYDNDGNWFLEDGEYDIIVGDQMVKLTLK